jgi:hypothetical protein
MKLASLGVSLGLIGALARRVIRTLLFDIAPTDPPFAVIRCCWWSCVGGLLVAGAVATKVDPWSAAL